MKALGIIPARYASTRFPGKPLAMIGNKSMIQRVYEQALKSKIISYLIVATDDQRIFDHVAEFGGHVVMTSDKHTTGTERCMEALQKSETESIHFDIVINIQGDEPFIEPEQIDKVAACFSNEQTQIATLAKYIENTESMNNTNIVKLVKDINNKAIYFSRFPIPFQRNTENDIPFKKNKYLKHIGLYAFRSNILKEIVELAPTPLELSESLEQLRWIENGYSIYVNITDYECIAIDTPEDLTKAKIQYEKTKSNK